jgi:2-keto-4-pentenoate hydratase
VTDPVIAFRDLMAIARERRMALPRGSIVSTGSASLPFNLAGPRAEIVARFLDTEFGFHTVAPPGGTSA